MSTCSPHHRGYLPAVPYCRRLHQINDCQHGNLDGMTEVIGSRAKTGVIASFWRLHVPYAGSCLLSSTRGFFSKLPSKSQQLICLRSTFLPILHQIWKVLRLQVLMSDSSFHLTVLRRTGCSHANLYVVRLGSAVLDCCNLEVSDQCW